MTQLVQLEEHSRSLARRDTVVIAISADEQGKVDETIATHNITFPVLSDAELKVIKSYHVLHPTKGIALPMTYIIDPSGKIRWRYRPTREAHHPPMDLVLKALDAVQLEDSSR